MPHSPTSVTMLFSGTHSPDRKSGLPSSPASALKIRKSFAEEREGNGEGRNNNEWEEDLQLDCSSYESDFNGHAYTEGDDDDRSFSTFNDTVNDDDDDDQTFDYDDASFNGSTESNTKSNDSKEDGDEDDDMFVVSNDIIGGALLSNSSDEGNVFILLLDPVEKIFEVILVSYLRDKTSLGDLLRMIVLRAKEPSLGFQQYIGFCKLRDKTELLDIDVLVHSTIISTDGSTNCAKMVDGDMLIAIPKNYDGKEMLKLGERVLQNAQVRKVVQKCVEIDESKTAATTRKVEKNARKKSVPIHTNGTTNIFNKSMSDMSLFSQHSVNDESSASASVPSSMPLSLQNNAEDEAEVMSSWSKSFERSFILGTHNVKSLRKSVAAKQSKVRKTCGQVATIAVSYTIGSYLCNSDGYFMKASRDNNSAFGVLGAVQAFCILSALMKYQLHSNYEEPKTKNGSFYNSY